MDQKLHHFLFSLPSRAAWIIIAGCAAFWAVCLTGVLIPPVSVAPNVTLFWFYAMLMLALATGVAAIGAAGALVVHARRKLAATSVPDAAAAADDSGSDQLAGLGRILDDPDDLLAVASPTDRDGYPGDGTQEAVPALPLPVVPHKASRRRPRKRRR